MKRLTQFTKSKTDKRNYQYLVLPNKLRCLLISDPQTEHSAASIDVRCGSLHDPKEIPGLAHFCEHMLFLGTHKFPNENDYGNYIKSHGGEKNAFTSALDTNYYFSIGNKAFEGALDRFSEFFKSPLFNASSVNREINAVDSEHKKNLQNDSRRLDQILMNHTNPNSKLNRFTTGNTETLRKNDIREKLLQFHNENYSSNLMTLTLLGNHSMEMMEKYALQYFSEIPNKNLPRMIFNDPAAYDSSNLRKMYKVVPISSRHMLKLKWLFPDTRQYYKSKPGNYISFLIGHEGPNSLLSYLLDEELALSLSCGVEEEEANTAFLETTIELTEKGLNNYERVISIVSAYINMIQRKGVQKYIFDENATMSSVRFMYKSQIDPIDSVSDLSYTMHHYDGNDSKILDLLCGPYIVSEYRPDLISDLLNLLVPENMLVILSSKKFESSKNLQTEKWYGTKYLCENIDPKLFDAIKNSTVQNIGKSINNKNLEMPPENTLIPKNFEILPNLTNLEQPRILYSNQQSTKWYKQDHKFKVPKAYGFCQIDTNDKNMPFSYESGQAWKYKIALFFERIREFMYMAGNAGIECDLSHSGAMIDMNFYGFNDSLLKIVEQFLQKFDQFNPKDEQKLFELKHAQFLRALKSSLYHSPYSIAANNWKVGISAFGKNQFEIMDLMQKFNFNEFILNTAKSQHGKLFENNRFTWFLSGNLSENDAVKISEKAEKIIGGNSMPENMIVRNRTIEIPVNTEYVYTKKLPNENEQNSCIISYFQSEPYLDTELNKWALNSLVFEVIKEPCFDFLRTKMQLGYIVDSSSYIIRRILGGRFLIQSNKLPPEALYERINIFLNEMRGRILKMTDSEFKKYVESVCIPLRQKPISLVEESVQFWNEIANKQCMFDRDEQKIAVLNKITKSQFIEYFEDLFFNKVKRYDYCLVCKAHWEENEKLKRTNIQKSMRKRIEIENEIQMREMNKLYPDIYLLNSKKNK